MSVHSPEACDDIFGCKIRRGGTCLGAKTVTSEARYIGAADITPSETREGATDKLARFKAAFGPVCLDQDVFSAAAEEVAKKIQHYAWPEK